MHCKGRLLHMFLLTIQKCFQTYTKTSLPKYLDKRGILIDKDALHACSITQNAFIISRFSIVAFGRFLSKIVKNPLDCLERGKNQKKNSSKVWVIKNQTDLNPDHFYLRVQTIYTSFLQSIQRYVSTKHISAMLSRLLIQPVFEIIVVIT